MGTEVDVTDLVEKARSTWVTWATGYLFGLEAAIPGMEWVALPVISDIDKAILEAILDALSKSVVMEGFFINTAIRKASQAQDYLSAKNFKDSLPENVSDADFEKAERAEIDAFISFAAATA